jgi:4'-phosphopantetheinyl transferase
MGISYIKVLSGNAMLGLWHMTETWREMRAALELTPEDEATLEAKTKEHRKLEWLACRLLLKNMVNGQVRIGYDDNRKPFLRGDQHFISMSHSGAYAAMYLHPGQSIGIDIQQMKPSISKGADYFLNPEEMGWADLENNVLLHTIWSAKESVFKYAGNADLDLKKHIITKPLSGNQKGIIEVTLLNAGHRETVRVQYDNFQDYVLTWTI